MEENNNISEEQFPPKDNTKKTVSLNIIAIGFVLILVGAICGWFAIVDQPPDSADYSQEKYDELIESHNNLVTTLAAVALLFSEIGVIILAWGLFYLPLSSNSELLPKWIRVSLMIGALLFIIRLFTTDISITDAMALGLISEFS